MFMCDFYLLDLSGIYTRKKFWDGNNPVRIDLRDISGTNCYCEEQSAAEIRERTKNLCRNSIRFIDSGNYHYVSFLLAGSVKEPFNMLVFDHHTDMQNPQFGDILSCGGWIRYLIKDHPYLKKLVLIGPPRMDFQEVDDDLKQKVIFVDQEHEQKAEEVIRTELAEFPLYISVDKDVLDKEYAETAWTQGTMSDQVLLRLLGEAAGTAGAGRILAVDVCGEQPPEAGRCPDPNDRTNARILNWYRGLQDEE